MKEVKGNTKPKSGSSLNQLWKDNVKSQHKDVNQDRMTTRERRPGNEWTFLAASYLQTVAFWEQRCRRRSARIPKYKLQVSGGKTSKHPQSLCLCASSAMGRWGWAKASQASSFWLWAICRRSHFWSRAAGGVRHGLPNFCLKFEVSRQESSPSLCASVRAVPWAD